MSAGDTIDLSTIKYGLGTTAVYVANAEHPESGGVLTVTGDDGKSISLTLVGDYRDAHFAGSDEAGHTLITIHANDDAPTFTTTDPAQLTASVSEQPGITGDSSTLDPTPAATGAIDFTDIDLTDRPTVTSRRSGRDLARRRWRQGPYSVAYDRRDRRVEGRADV